jgi:Xaa-Pro aminopeptidase
MKAKFTSFIIGSSLLLGAPALFAQTNNTNTNSLSFTQTLKYQVALENDRDLGEHALFPPGLREKLKLTEEQRAELIPIEEDFAKTSLEYQTANQPRIDAAMESIRRARESKNPANIEAARHQLQQMWAGLQKYRDESVRQVKLLLTPDQLAILEDPGNAWREEHGSEVNDPSAN